jgi:predicted ester cyclase
MVSYGRRGKRAGKEEKRVARGEQGCDAALDRCLERGERRRGGRVRQSDAFVRHDPNAPEVRGPVEEKQLMAMYFSAFPDLRFAVEDMVAEGDKVVLRYTIRGTHRGELMGIPLTDKQVTLTATETYRLAGGKIEEQWVNMDALGMMQQLGAIPQPGESVEPSH